MHRILLTLSILAASSFAHINANDYAVLPISEQQAAEYDLDTNFYKKATEAEGILIATSDRVSDLAHREAAYQFGMIMQRIAEPIAQRIRERKVLCLLIGHQELTSQLPQFTAITATGTPIRLAASSSKRNKTTRF